MRGARQVRSAAGTAGGGAKDRRLAASVRVLAMVVAVALALALLPAAPASALEVRTRATTRILGGLQTYGLEIQLGSGAVARGNALRFHADDPDIELRPRLGQGTIAGTESLQTMARRELRRGGIAAINGGYWLPRPWGAPNGPWVERGTMLSGQAVGSTTSSGRPTGRGAVGWHADGTMVMDRVAVTLELDRPNAPVDTEETRTVTRPDPDAPVEEPVEDPDAPPGVVRIDELNRQVWPESEARRRPDGELLLFTDRFGTSVTIPSGTTIATVDGLRVTTGERNEGTVVHVRQVTHATTVAVPEGQALLVAYGRREADLIDVQVGEVVGIRARFAPEATAEALWEGLDGAVAGGQLLVRDGRRRPADEWGTFAAFGDSHLARNPRTAIGRTADGRILLVTVDGRRRGWSVGLSMRELADTMLALGAVDAVNLDGGGSTMMLVDGAVRNRPSQSGRTVADGLFVYVPQPAAARELAAACGDIPLLAGTSFTDVSGTTHEQAIGCLAAWRVTTGVTTTTFAPDDPITRGQMASFIARWIDDVAERGSGRTLAAAGRMPFGDVTAGNVHRDAIARLAAAGIIGGRTASTFEPSASVTRAQTATMVAAAMEHVTGQALPDGRDTFVDDNGSTHEPNIDRLAQTGIVTGAGGFAYRPDDRVTRGAMASVLMRATAALVEQGVAVRPGDGSVLVEAGTTDDPTG